MYELLKHLSKLLAPLMGPSPSVVRSSKIRAVLDILLTRSSDGTIETSVYRKKTHTDRYLNFASHHPLYHKKSVVRSLLSQAKALSSTAMESKMEERRVSKVLTTVSLPASSDG